MLLVFTAVTYQRPRQHRRPVQGDRLVRTGVARHRLRQVARRRRCDHRTGRVIHMRGVQTDLSAAALGGEHHLGRVHRHIEVDPVLRGVGRQRQRVRHRVLQCERRRRGAGAIDPHRNQQALRARRGRDDHIAGARGSGDHARIVPDHPQRGRGQVRQLARTGHRQGGVVDHDRRHHRLDMQHPGRPGEILRQRPIRDRAAAATRIDHIKGAGFIRRRARRSAGRLGLVRQAVAIGKVTRKVEILYSFMKKVINFAKEFSPTIIAFVLPTLAFAQTLPPAQPPVPTNVPQGNIQSLNGVLQSLCTVFAYMFYFLIVLAVIFVLIAAFRYLTASGDPEKVKGAGTMLIYTAVAIGVALLARAIPLVVASFLGASGVTSC